MVAVGNEPLLARIGTGTYNILMRGRLGPDTHTNISYVQTELIDISSALNDQTSNPSSPAHVTNIREAVWPMEATGIRQT